MVSSSLRAVLGPTSAPPTAIQYQWQRATTGSESFSDISGATGLANSPTAQDLGLSLRIQASLTNGAGLDNPALSLHSPVVQRLIEAQGNTLLSQNPISEWLSVWRGGPGASMALELTYSLPSGVSARTAESSSDGCLTPLTYRAGAHHHPDHHRKVLVNPRLTAISGKVTTTIAAAHVLSSFDAASGRALALEVPLSTEGGQAVGPQLLCRGQHRRCHRGLCTEVQTQIKEQFTLTRYREIRHQGRIQQNPMGDPPTERTEPGEPDRHQSPQGMAENHEGTVLRQTCQPARELERLQSSRPSDSGS